MPAASPPSGPGCGVLRCCAVRPPGIYGPGEQRHLPRILHHVKQGLLLFTFGDGQADWVHVDNLVDCMLLAAEGLRAERGCVAGGQAYFVSDGAPVKHFDFLGPILQQLGYKMPKTRIHWRVMQAFAAINEFVHALLGPLLQVPLPLCMAEVVKVAIPHYFSIEKAHKELGFAPKSFTARSVADWYSEHGYACGRLTSEERTCEAQAAAHDTSPTGDSRRGLRPVTRTASARSRLQSFLRRRKAAASGPPQDGAARTAPVVLSPSLPPTASSACVNDAEKSKDSKAVGRGWTMRGRGALTSSSFRQLLLASLSRSFPPTLHLASQQQPGL
ncbi:3-beta hydroxysteroid dehydrogenase/isomerase family-domain-containing protein [Haematococcus lacustris]